MRFDRSTVIIGFRVHLCNLDELGKFASAEDKAWDCLKNTGDTKIKLPGLVGVVRRLKYLNAVVLEIEPDQFDAFTSMVTAYDPVEYCDINYSLKPADLTDSISPEYRSGISAGRIIRDYHLCRPISNGTLGLGTRIALIDSGISPHPLLPSLSSSELVLKVKTMHWSIPADKRNDLCKFLEQAETRLGGSIIGSAVRPLPLTCTSRLLGPSDHPDLYDEALRIAKRFKKNIWTGWEQDVRLWSSSGRRAGRPSFPYYPKLYGQCRLISPLSRSFLPGELSFGINDVIGHGTQMASLISAMRPSIDCTNSHVQPDVHADNATELELDIVGIAPYAELMVLKCCHDIDQNDGFALNGWMLNAIDAMTYIIDNGADVVYLGFSINNCNLNAAVAADGLLSKLKQNGCVVVAPAGNDSTSMGFPACSDHVSAIGALTFSSQSRLSNDLCKADYSPIANSRVHEVISFSAFGGDRSNSVLTASRDFGYSAVWGTSISAAIAAAVYSAEIGAEDVRAFEREYDKYIGTTGQIDVAKVRATLENWRPQRRLLDDLDLALESKVAMCKESNDPDGNIKVGRGVIRV